MEWKQNKLVGLVAILVTILSVAFLIVTAVFDRTRDRTAVQQGREWQTYEEQLGRPPTKDEAEAFFAGERPNEYQW